MSEPPEICCIDDGWNDVIVFIWSRQAAVSVKECYNNGHTIEIGSYFGARGQNCLKLVVVEALKFMVVFGGGALEESFKHNLQRLTIMHMI